MSDQNLTPAEADHLANELVKMRSRAKIQARLDELHEEHLRLISVKFAQDRKRIGEVNQEIQELKAQLT